MVEQEGIVAPAAALDTIQAPAAAQAAAQAEPQADC
jgi:hypothetical protein